MSETPITDKLSTFLVTQFPATLGNLELDKHLCELERCERELNEAKREIELIEKAWRNERECTKTWKAMAQELAEHFYQTKTGNKEAQQVYLRFNELNKS